MKRQLAALIGIACFMSAGLSHGSEAPPKDFLDFAAGAVPVAFGAEPKALKTGFEHALSAIDGDPGAFYPGKQNSRGPGGHVRDGRDILGQTLSCF